MKRILKISLFVIVNIVSICAVMLFFGCNGKGKFEKIYNDDSLITSYNSYGDSTLNKSVSDNGLSVSSSSFSGVETLIYSFTVNENTSAYLNIEYHEAVTFGGKIKIVLADNHNVYVIGEYGKLSDNFFAQGSYGSVHFEEIPNGIYSLKIIGVEARFDMIFTYEQG